MGIELDGGKKRFSTDNRFNIFFLPIFNSTFTNNDFGETTKLKALREIDAYFAKGHAEIFKGHSCNLPGALGTVSVSSSSQRIIKQLKKMVLVEKENWFFRLHRA